MPEVTCRQLGFPHGTRVDPVIAQRQRPPPPCSSDDYSTPPDRYYYEYSGFEAEGAEALERTWLTNVKCSGSEARLVDCDLDRGFRDNIAGCGGGARIHVACRQFPLVQAIESGASPGASAGVSGQRHVRHTARGGG